MADCTNSHAAAFWDPDGSVKQSSATGSDVYSHFLESDQQQQPAEMAQHSMDAAGGGIYASFDDLQQPPAAEPDLYAAFAE